MESKDWIILLVPIFAEGLFFFLIQNYINTKFKQIEMRKNHQKEVLHQFHVLLQDFYTAYLGIQAIDERRSGRNVSFHEVWNPAQAKIDKLIIFHAANPCAIKKLDKDFAECISKWQYISSVLYESRINNNGKISANDDGFPQVLVTLDVGGDADGVCCHVHGVNALVFIKLLIL